MIKYRIIIPLNNTSIIYIDDLVAKVNEFYTQAVIKLHCSLNTIEITNLQYDLDSYLIEELLPYGDIIIKKEEENG